MSIVSVILFLQACLMSWVKADFGPAAWEVVEANSSSSYITNVRTTMRVPSLPAQQGLLYWPGLYTEEGWLVQSIISNEPDYLELYVAHSSVYELTLKSYVNSDRVHSYCPGSGTGNQWCAFTYAFKSGLSVKPAGKGAIVQPGDLIDIAYDFDEKSGNTTQTIALGGTGISQLSVATGPGYRFEDTIECHGDYNAPVPAQTYVNTSIVLAERNPSFNGIVYANASTPTSIESSDGGKSWIVPEIHIQASTCASDG